MYFMNFYLLVRSRESHVCSMCIGIIIIIIVLLPIRNYTLFIKCYESLIFNAQEGVQAEQFTYIKKNTQL